jgi:hypothetical protein
VSTERIDAVVKVVMSVDVVWLVVVEELRKSVDRKDRRGCQGDVANRTSRYS